MRSLILFPIALVIVFPLEAQTSAPKCRFAAQYQSIKSDKTDPRVAYIETYPRLHSAEAKDSENSSWNPFTEACLEISHQSTATTTFFDLKHKYLQVYTSEGGNVFIDSFTYFAGAPGHPGIMLRSLDDADQFSTSIFVFENGKWQDATDRYLASFKLAKTDFLIAPQYGRSARILHFNQATTSFHPKGWLTWDGEKFELSTAKTVAGWRCPDTSPKIFTAEFFGESAPPELRKQFCQAH